MNGKKYVEYPYDIEKDLEKVVVSKSKEIFGDKTVYIDIKKKVGKKSSHLRTIPDGFLINCLDPDKPELYFVENELEEKPKVYDHLASQVSKFISAIQTEPMEIQSMIIDLIEENT